MHLPHKTLERKLFSKGYKYIIAVDEVGIGSLAGPVTVCAVLFTKKFFGKRKKNLHWLRDSKQLLSHQRENFVAELLKEKDMKFKVAYCYPKTIDKINVYQAARQAMRKSIRKILGNRYKIRNTIILVDGKTEIKNLDIPQMAIVKGDRKVFSIACASLIAKVARDKTMKNYAKKFPGYGFEKHKGYATKYHKIQLTGLGPCKIHRKSFAPVRQLL